MERLTYFMQIQMCDASEKNTTTFVSIQESFEREENKSQEVSLPSRKACTDWLAWCELKERTEFTMTSHKSNP